MYIDRASRRKFRYPRLFYVFIPIMLTVFLFGIASHTNSDLYTDFNGYAADSKGNIYIGLKHDILKLSAEGEELARIESGTSRGWHFTVVNNKLLIDLGDQYLLKDENGALVKTYPNDELDIVMPYGNRFVAEDGTLYVQKDFPRTTFCRIQNGEETIVYQISVFAAVCRVIQIIGFISLFVMIPILIYQSIKINT